MHSPGIVPGFNQICSAYGTVPRWVLVQEVTHSCIETPPTKRGTFQVDKCWIWQFRRSLGKGHIKPQCPKLIGKQQVARVKIEELTEEDEELSETPTNREPMDGLDESTYPQEGEDDLKKNSGDKEEYQPQYEWDDQEYKVNLIRSINEEPIIDTTVRVAAGTIDKTVEPICNYHTRIKNRSRPLWKHKEYRAISVFWEIGGVKAHCLIDRGCEGVMISPEFTWAAKIKTFTLEKPIGLQLAVTGSKFIINYGTNTTIKINCEESKEYFNVINIDYYYAILGTLFLKKFKVMIDFVKDWLKIKDNIILNQADEYKIRQENSWKDTSVKALNVIISYWLSQKYTKNITKSIHNRRLSRSLSGSITVMKWNYCTIIIEN